MPHAFPATLQINCKQELLEELGFPEIDKIIMFTESLSALSVVEKFGFTQATKAIRIKSHNVRYCKNEEKIIALDKVLGTENPSSGYSD